MKKILMSVLLVMILGVCGVCVACDDGPANRLQIGIAWIELNALEILVIVKSALGKSGD